MLGKRSRRGSRSEADKFAAAFLAERETLGTLVSEILPPGDVSAVMQFLNAPSPREILAVVQEHPWLASDRGEAALRMLAAMVGLAELRLVHPWIDDRRSWLVQLLEAGLRPERMSLPDD